MRKSLKIFAIITAIATTLFITTGCDDVSSPDIAQDNTILSQDELIYENSRKRESELEKKVCNICEKNRLNASLAGDSQAQLSVYPNLPEPIPVEGFSEPFYPNSKLVKCYDSTNQMYWYYPDSRNSDVKTYVQVWGIRNTWSAKSCANYWAYGKEYDTLPASPVIHYPRLMVEVNNNTIKNGDNISNFEDYIWPPEYATQPGRPGGFPITVVIKNIGTQQMKNISASITPAHEFCIVESPQNSLGVNSSTYVKVLYNSSRIGQHYAQLKITSDDPNNNSFIIDLHGITKIPTARIQIHECSTFIENNSEYNKFELGLISAEYGSPIVEKIFTILNVGELPLSIGTVQIDNSIAFSITQQPDTQLIMDKFGGNPRSATFKVKFSVQSQGYYSARISLANGDSNMNPFTFTLKGNAAPLEYFSIYNTPVGAWLNEDGSRVKTIPMDVNGDQKTDLVRLWNENGKTIATVILSNGSVLNQSTHTPVGNWLNADGSRVETFPMDVNGDGKDDLVRLWHENNSANATVIISNGSGFSMYSNTLIGNWFNPDGSRVKTFPMDINADKKIDLVRLWNKNGIANATVILSNGSGFSMCSNMSVGGWLNADGSHVETIPMDVNGDGKSDLVRLWHENNSAFATTILSNGSLLNTSTHTPIGNWFNVDGSRVETIPMDVNGDHKTDLVTIWNNNSTANATILLSNGDGFSMLSNSAVGSWLNADGSLVENFPMDVNGDGKIDLVRVWNNKGIAEAAVILSTGIGFKLISTNPVGSWCDEGTNATRNIPMDVNGDDKIDLVRFWNNNGLANAMTALSNGSGFQK